MSRWAARQLAALAEGDRVLLRPHPQTPGLYVGTVVFAGPWPEVEKGRAKWGLLSADEVLCAVPYWEMPQERWRSSS